MLYHVHPRRRRRRRRFHRHRNACRGWRCRMSAGELDASEIFVGGLGIIPSSSDYRHPQGGDERGLLSFFCCPTV